MGKLAFIFVFLVNFAIANDKVIGGVETNSIEHPWQMSLQLRYAGHFCGAVLISEDTLLTAAHCVSSSRPGDVYIKGASKDGTLKRLRKYGKARVIIIHPEFKRSAIVAHDIAIVKTRKKITDLQPIKLPHADSFPGDLDEYFRTMSESIFVTGWGMTRPPNRLPIPSNQMMKAQIKALGSSNIDLGSKTLRSYITDRYGLSDSTMDYIQDYGARTLLSEGHEDFSGACAGDSGGPVFAKTKSGAVLLGIASYVAGGEKQCLGIAGSTNVQAYLDFIKENL